MQVNLDPLTLHIGDAEIEYTDTPAGNPELGLVTGRAIFGLVSGPSQVNVDIAHIAWPHGVRELKTVSANASPSPLDSTTGRTSLFPGKLDGRDVMWMYLEALTPGKKNPSRPSAQHVTREHLDWILGSSFEALVVEHRALAYGTGVETRGDESPSRNCLSVAFEPDNISLPLIAFAITRQLARVRGFDKATWSA